MDAGTTRFQYPAIAARFFARDRIRVSSSVSEAWCTMSNAMNWKHSCQENHVNYVVFLTQTFITYEAVFKACELFHLKDSRYTVALLNEMRYLLRRHLRVL